MKTIIIICITWFALKLGNYKTTTTTDYRDVYCGTYTGTKTYQHLNELQTALVFNNSNCQIIISKNATDSILNIATSEGTYTAKLKNGVFSHQTKRFFGKFSNDSIYLNYIPSLAPISYKYVAKK